MSSATSLGISGPCLDVRVCEGVFESLCVCVCVCVCLCVCVGFGEYLCVWVLCVFGHACVRVCACWCAWVCVGLCVRLCVFVFLGCRSVVCPR